MSIFTPIGNALGISGQQQPYWSPQQAPQLSAQGNQALNDQYNVNQSLYGNNNLQNSLQSYGSGQGSVADALAGYTSASGGSLTPDQQIAFNQQMAVSPETATRYAAGQVQDNPIYSGLYGQGGMMQTAENNYQQLADPSKPWGFDPTQATSLGQAYGNVAQQSGEAGNQLANSLAARGLGGGASGSAIAGMSGIQTSANQNLAQMSNQLAQYQQGLDLQKLNSYGNMAATLGGQAQGAMGQQLGANQYGVGEQQSQNQSVFNNAMDMYGQQSKNWQAMQGFGLQSQENMQANKGPTLGQAFGQGLMSSATQIGAAPGTAATAGAKSFGSATGANYAPSS